MNTSMSQLGEVLEETLENGLVWVGLMPMGLLEYKISLGTRIGQGRKCAYKNTLCLEYFMEKRNIEKARNQWAKLFDNPPWQASFLK